MNGKDWAVVIAAIGTLGLPVLILIFTVGSLFAGFALYSILNFLSSWFIPIIFLGAAFIILIELVPHGPYGILAGTLSFIGLMVFGYFAWAGAFRGPANTYSLILSLGGKSTGPIAMPDIATFVVAIVLAIAGLVYLVIREYE
ncbi:MAG: hypothetical protein JRN15_22530 [Nitrososphaerota archaeon]|nr:hypothetical protein [Nitrososphaerota archaeon]